MAQIKARLKQVRLKNISKFKEEQTVNFKTGNTFTFIGNNESGTLDFIEAIRRCCETNINHSFSCAYDKKSPSIVVCTFESEMENENISKIDTTEDSTTKTSNVDGCERLEHTNSFLGNPGVIRSNNGHEGNSFRDEDEAIDKADGKSNVYVQSRIPQRAEEIQKTNVEPTKEMTAHLREIPDIASNSNVDGGSTKSQTLVSVYIQWKVNNGAQEALKVLVLRKGIEYSSESIVLSIIKDEPLHLYQPSAILDQDDCKQILTGDDDLNTLIGILEKLMEGKRDDLKTGENKFDKIFQGFVDIEFLFPYRVASLQSSEQIKTCPQEINYQKASSDSYVINEFIKNNNQNRSCYDENLEKKIFERLSIIKDVKFKYDEKKLSVVIGKFTHSILKAPEEILAAKYLSITLSKRKAILIIAEPGRDMDLAMKRRMINLVFQDKEMLGGAMVILTSHSKDFLTPMNLEHTFIVMNDVEDGSKIRPAKPDNNVQGKGYLSCRFLSMLVVCDRILFVEGQSDCMFVETMLHMFMNNKDLIDEYLKALQEELKCPSPEQLMSFLLSLSIEKMDGGENVRKINNACKDLEMCHNRYFLLDFDTFHSIEKKFDIVLTGQKSSVLVDLEERGIFLWDDDSEVPTSETVKDTTSETVKDTKTSETVKDTKTSETVKDTKTDKCTHYSGISVTLDKDGGKMNTPGTMEDMIVRVQASVMVEDTNTSDKGTQCTIIAMKSDKDGWNMNKPGSIEDVIVRFSNHHDSLYHDAKPEKCDIKYCKGLVDLLNSQNMVSFEPRTIENKVTDKGKVGRVKIIGKFLLKENLTNEDILTIVKRYLDCSISNREGQIWRFLKFIGAKASETRPAS